MSNLADHGEDSMDDARSPSRTGQRITRLPPTPQSKANDFRVKSEDRLPPPPVQPRQSGPSHDYWEADPRIRMDTRGGIFARPLAPPFRNFTPIIPISREFIPS